MRSDCITSVHQSGNLIFMQVLSAVLKSVELFEYLLVIIFCFIKLKYCLCVELGLEAKSQCLLATAMLLNLIHHFSL